MDINKLEKQKREAYETISSSKNIDDVTKAINQYVHVQFIQSKEAWRTNNKKFHPSFDTYFTHWFYSTFSELKDIMDTNIYSELQKKFETMEKPNKIRLTKNSKYFQ